MTTQAPEETFTRKRVGLTTHLQGWLVWLECGHAYYFTGRIGAGEDDCGNCRRGDPPGKLPHDWATP